MSFFFCSLRCIHIVSFATLKHFQLPPDYSDPVILSSPHRVQRFPAHYVGPILILPFDAQLPFDISFPFYTMPDVL